MVNSNLSTINSWSLSYTINTSELFFIKYKNRKEPRKRTTNKIRRQECPLPLPPFNVRLEGLTNVIRQDKEITGIQIGKKEVRLFLFTDNINFHSENPMEYAKKVIRINK